MAGEGRGDYYALLGIGRDARLTPRSGSPGVAPLPDREACGIEDGSLLV